MKNLLQIFLQLKAPIVSILIVLIFLMNYACKKPKIDTPTTLSDFSARPGKCSPYDRISGYLVAGVQPPASPGPNPYAQTLSLFAIFSDPERNLPGSYSLNQLQTNSGPSIGNLSMGKVYYGIYGLTFSNNGFYTASGNSYKIPDTISWSIQGNKGFDGFDFTFINPFAKVKVDTSVLFSVSPSEGGSFEATKYASGYDSLFLSHGYNTFYKSLKYQETSISITDEEVRKYFSTQLNYRMPVELQGAKYYCARVGGKNYQFVFLNAVNVKSIVSD